MRIEDRHSRIVEQVRGAGRVLVTELAERFDVTGVLAVELFAVEEAGRPTALYVNELAMRPHNSGHWTLDAADCSQFEQQARVMAGLPLGSTAQVRPVIMLNILGNAWYPVAPPPAEPTEPDWSAVLAHPGAHLHLYGKDEARMGRKMGHVNIVADTLDAAREQAAAIGHQVAQPLVEG